MQIIFPVKAAIILIVVIAGSSAAVLVIGPDIGGLVGLVFAGNQQQEKNDGKVGQNIGEGSAETGSSGEAMGDYAESLGTELGFEVVKFTELDANLKLGGEAVPDCPDTAEVAIKVKNTGRYAAEQLTINANPAFVIKGCSMCRIERLEAGGEKEINMQICKSSDRDLEFSIGAVNAEPIKLNSR